MSWRPCRPHPYEIAADTAASTSFFVATQNGAQRRGYKHSVHLWPRERSGARSRRRCTSPRARRRRWGCSWRWSRRWPTRFRAVSSTCVEKVDAVFSAPDDHFGIGPHCRVIVSSGGNVHGAGGCPTIRTGIIFSASVEQARADPAPHDHFAASPHCRVNVSGSGRVGGAGGCPTVRAGIVSPTAVQHRAVVSTPDDHFTPGPDCRLIVSFGRGVGRVDTCPTIRARIVSPARVSIATISTSAPDDHFTAGPDCRVPSPAIRRIGGVGGCPTVSAWVISPAGVQIPEIVILSAPDDHLTASPDCRVKEPGCGRVGGAGGCPSIRRASGRRIRYERKDVLSTRRCHDLRRLVLRAGFRGSRPRL